MPVTEGYEEMSAFSEMHSVMPWTRALVRTGFKAMDVGDLGVSLAAESDRNLRFFERLVHHGGFGFLEGRSFRPYAPDVIEEHWLGAYDVLHGGSEGGRFDDLDEMDTRLAGVVRALNDYGLRTTCSCEGHGRTSPVIEFATSRERDLALALIRQTKVGVRAESEMLLRFVGKLPARGVVTGLTAHLLDLAEWLEALARNRSRDVFSERETEVPESIRKMG